MSLKSTMLCDERNRTRRYNKTPSRFNFGFNLMNISRGGTGRR